MKRFRLALNLQLFAAEEDEDEDIEGEDIDGEVISKDEDLHLDSGGNRHSSSGLGVRQALDEKYWKQFLDLQDMQNEKVDKHLTHLMQKLEDLDARHQGIPASMKAELEALFEAHKEAGNIAEDAAEGKKLSKYAERHNKNKEV